MQPLLPSYAFPRHVLGDEELSAALSDERLARIRDSVRNQNTPGSMIDYRTRWFDWTPRPRARSWRHVFVT